jgi:hypothetical protein
VDTSILKEHVISVFRVEGGVGRCDEVIYEGFQEGGPLGSREGVRKQSLVRANRNGEQEL